MAALPEEPSRMCVLGEPGCEISNKKTILQDVDDKLGVNKVLLYAPSSHLILVAT